MAVAVRTFAKHALTVRQSLATDGADDGIPVPGGRLIELVAGDRNLARFLDLGERAATTVRDAATRNGLTLDGDILDFGCGCGRVIRHLRELPSLHGCDYNPTLIRWATRNLRFARFATNSLMPPLPYPADSFDLVYAFSVFTHLTVAAQEAWRDELGRVIRPGGALLVSLHSDSYLDGRMTDAEAAAYRQGEIVLRGEWREGENYCAAFHPPGSVAPLFDPGFRLLEHTACGARGNPDQDLYVLRRE